MFPGAYIIGVQYWGSISGLILGFKYLVQYWVQYLGLKLGLILVSIFGFGFNIQFNIGFIIGFNIWLNIGFNIRFNIGSQYWVQYWESILDAISVIDVPMNLHLKFHQNRVSNSWDITNIEFVWGGGVGWVGWCAKSFSCLTQLKVMLGWVELWLSWGFDNFKT